MKTKLPSDKKYHYLYKTTNIINKKFYIGAHSTDNLNDKYLGSGTYLKKSIKKYGRENFIIEILNFFDTRDKLMLEEKRFVNKDLVEESLCMNLTIGGSCAPDSNLGSKRTEEQCKNISNSLLGRKLSEIHKENLRKPHNMSPTSLAHYASEEYRNKLSKSNSNKIFTSEHKNKISNSKKGVKHTKEHNLNIKNSCKDSWIERKLKESFTKTSLKTLSGFQGIIFKKDCERKKPWKAIINREGKYFCKYFENIESAVEWRNKMIALLNTQLNTQQ